MFTSNFCLILPIINQCVDMRSWKHDQSSIIDTIYTTELLRKLESPFLFWPGISQYAPLCAAATNHLDDDKTTVVAYGLTQVD